MPLLKVTRSFPPRATHNCITPTMNGRTRTGPRAIHPTRPEQAAGCGEGRLGVQRAKATICSVLRDRGGRRRGRRGQERLCGDGGHKTLCNVNGRDGEDQLMSERASESVCPLASPPSIHPSFCPSIVSGMHGHSNHGGSRTRTYLFCRPVCFGPRFSRVKAAGSLFPPLYYSHK